MRAFGGALLICLVNIAIEFYICVCRVVWVVVFEWFEFDFGYGLNVFDFRVR